MCACMRACAAGTHCSAREVLQPRPIRCPPSAMALLDVAAADPTQRRHPRRETRVASGAWLAGGRETGATSTAGAQRKDGSRGAAADTGSTRRAPGAATRTTSPPTAARAGTRSRATTGTSSGGGGASGGPGESGHIGGPRRTRGAPALRPTPASRARTTPSTRASARSTSGVPLTRLGPPRLPPAEAPP